MKTHHNCQLVHLKRDRSTKFLLCSFMNNANAMLLIEVLHITEIKIACDNRQTSVGGEIWLKLAYQAVFLELTKVRSIIKICVAYFIIVI